MGSKVYKKKSPNQIIYSGIEYTYKILLKHFKEIEKTNKQIEKNKDYTWKEKRVAKMENLVAIQKLSGSLGFLAQVRGQMAKTVEFDDRLAKIEKKLNMKEDEDKVKNHPDWGK